MLCIDPRYFCRSSFIYVSAFVSIFLTNSIRADNVINQGTDNWVATARAERADMLIIGDSVVGFGGDGWDAGFINAAQHHFGLAGTGLHGIGPLGDGYSLRGAFNQFFSHDPADVPSERLGYVWNEIALTAGSIPVNQFGFRITEKSILDPNAAYNWHIWSASPADGGSMTPYVRLGQAPYSVKATLPIVSTQTPTEGLQHTIMEISGTITDLGVSHEFLLDDITNTSILYTRLLRPDAPGVTVTSWGYGGKSTLDFYNDRYAGGTMTQEGRAAYMSSIVDGGSGKLNVLIAEGFNDRFETSPSLGGNPNGNSAEAFIDNVKTLMAQIRSDWAYAGNASDDLSFTLLGMYEIESYNEPLREYAVQLKQIALTDPSVSFIDLFSMAPSYEQAVELGYMADKGHPTREGAIAYAQLVMESLVKDSFSSDPVLPPSNGDDNNSIFGLLAMLRAIDVNIGVMSDMTVVDGDLNSDHAVTLTDLSILGQLFSGSFQVPEPTSVILLAFGSVLLMRRVG